MIHGAGRASYRLCLTIRPCRVHVICCDTIEDNRRENRDEMSTGFMPILVDKVFDALSELNRLYLSILLVAQNARRSLSTMSRRHVLKTGRICLEGSSKGLKSNPEVHKCGQEGEQITLRSRASLPTK
jgi:hypothetical protein